MKTTLLTYVPSIIFLIQSTSSQNIPNICQAVSPNNDPSLAGCQNGTVNFFRTEFPQKFFDQTCLCCTPGLDDNPPDECIFNETLHEYEGIISCEENFDCCLCGSIECNSCKVVSCNGDESCLGIKPIKINGDPKNGGASMNCDGDISCFNTEIIGEYITSILCGGDLSCANSTMDLNMNYNNYNNIKLEGISLNFNGDESCFNCVINAKNVGGIATSGDNALENSVINAECKMESVDKGCLIDIGGDRAAKARGVPSRVLVDPNVQFKAKNAKWNIVNVGALNVNGDEGTMNTEFILKFIPNGGPININGDYGAKNSIWTIFNGNGIRINGNSGAQNSVWLIDFIENGGRVDIGQPNAATNVYWNLKHVSTFGCQGVNACRNSKYIMSLIENKDASITLSGVDNAKDSIIIVDGSSGLDCDGLRSCENTQINMTCTKNDEINGCGLVCRGIDSCKSSYWNINNVNQITCASSKACSDTAWIINCDPTSGCQLTCEGGCSYAYMELTNTNGIDCRGGVLALNGTLIEGACESAIISMISNIGRSINCDAKRACYKSIIASISKIGIKSVVTNLEKEGISCKGYEACYDAVILGSCSDIINGCSLTCNGYNACSVSHDSLLVPIKLDYANEIYCINGCNNREFDISPAIKTDKFTLQCGDCKNSIFNINGQYMTNDLIVNSVQCSTSDSCRSATIKLLPTYNKTVIDEVKCGATTACYGLQFYIIINDINDYIQLNKFMCGGLSSCVGTSIIIKLGNVMLNANQLKSKLNDGSLSIDIDCSQDANCIGARINDIIPFGEMNNKKFIKKSSQNIMQSNIIKITFIGGCILIVLLIFILIKKHYNGKLQEQVAAQINKASINKNNNNKNDDNNKHNIKNIADATSEIIYEGDKTSKNVENKVEIQFSE